MREKTVATTCDYCHKPLSLMRRLRGEQFCSVEHMDLYTAQQAEFALQRLAASVEDKPIQQRPQALLKRIARPANQNGVNGHGSSNGTLVHEAPAEAVPESPIETVQLPEPPVSPVLEPEPEYPVAGFAPAAPIQARAPQTPPKTGIQPEEIAAEPNLESRKLRLDAAPVLAPPMAPMQEISSPAPPAAVEPSEVAPQSLQPAAFVPVLPIEAPAYETAPRAERVAVPLSVRDSWPELLARPVDLPAEFTAPLPEISALPDAEPVLLLQPPQLATLRLTTLRLLTAHSKSFGLAEFVPVINYDLTVGRRLDGKPTGALPLAPRILWTLQPISPATEFDSSVGPISPELSQQLPAISGAAIVQTLVAPPVPVPVPAPLAPRAPQLSPELNQDPWLQSLPRLQTPRMPLSAPQWGSAEPALTWDRIAPMDGSAPSDQPAEANVEAPGLAPRLRDFRARLAARFEIGPARDRSQWATPRIDSTILEPGVSANTRPAASPADIRMGTLPVPAPRTLGFVGPATFEPTLQQQPGPTASVPDSWKFPSVEAQPAMAFEPTPSLLPGALSPAEPYSPQRPPTLALQEPVRYCPASLVSMPRPNYQLGASAITAEGRFVALAPNGVYRLPRIQHTGYRMPGPYPKIPSRMPEVRGAAPHAVMAPPNFEIPIIWTWTRDTDPSVPRLEEPVPVRLHPADYFSWPAIKAPRGERFLPLRETDSVLGSAVGVNLTVRRFGPARAGLQAPLTDADLLNRTGA
ncbi:MAG: hypothetical protein RL328_2691 [Acidobacteriota bacterium]